MALSSSKYPTLSLPSLLTRDTSSPSPSPRPDPWTPTPDGSFGSNTSDDFTIPIGKGGRRRRPIVEIEYGPESARDADMGGRTMGLYSSLVLLVNNITGPGMLALPIAFTKGGISLSLTLLTFFGLVGTLSSHFICGAISRVPYRLRDGTPTPRMEYCPLVAYYFRGKYHYLTQFLYNFSLQTKTISSIIVSAQVMDKFCVFSIGSVRGLMLYPTLQYVVADPEEVIPFSSLGDHALIITMGYVLSVVLFLPLGLLNLDENVAFQWLSGIIMMLILCQFGVHFAESPSYPEEVSWVYGGSAMLAIGVIMFCFTFIDTVPSWYNEKRKDLAAGSTLTWSVILSNGIYFFIGIFGALAFPKIASGNILEIMADQGHSSTLTQISVYMFSLSTIGLGIPIFCIIMRYNLYVGNVMSSFGAKFWGAIFPWLVSFFLYQGTGFIRFVNWTSLIFTNFTNFILPSYLFILALDYEAEELQRDSELMARNNSDDIPKKSRSNSKGGKYGNNDNGLDGSNTTTASNNDNNGDDDDFSMIQSLLSKQRSNGNTTTDNDTDRPPSPQTPSGTQSSSYSSSFNNVPSHSTDPSQAAIYDYTNNGPGSTYSPDPSKKGINIPYAIRRPVPMNPDPLYFHQRYPKLLPWIVVYVMTLVSVLSLGIDLYYLIVHGIDLTDI